MYGVEPHDSPANTVVCNTDKPPQVQPHDPPANTALCMGLNPMTRLHIQPSVGVQPHDPPANTALLTKMHADIAYM